MPAHVFVDETKESGYLLTAAALLPSDLAGARRVMRSLVMPRQRRIHFNSEGDPRRKQILDVITEIGPEVTIYDSSAQPRRYQREACLRSMVVDLAAHNAHMLVIERDDSVVELDKRVLYRRVRETGCAESLSYRHLRAHEEPLLMIPDAIAWCWYRGGQWKTRVQPMVTAVRAV